MYPTGSRTPLPLRTTLADYPDVGIGIDGVLQCQCGTEQSEVKIEELKIWNEKRLHLTHLYVVR